MRRLLAATMVLLGLSLTNDLAARQTQGGPARVVGRVVDHQNGRPVTGAAVLVEGESRAITDDTGWFAVDAVPPGEREVTIEMLGYTTRTESISLSAGRSHQLSITLARQPIRLAPVEVTIRSATLEASGFYERERSGMGAHIDRPEIERRRPRLLTDLLRVVPGLRVIYIEAGRRHVRVNRGSSNDIAAFDPRQALALPGCEPDLYLDGRLYRERIPSDGTQNKVDGYDIVEPEIIEGIEVYAGSNAPLQYQNACGVILVWTRRANMMMTQTEVATVAASPAPSLTPGSLARITDRFGRRTEGIVRQIDADTIRIVQGEAARTFAVSELRELEADLGVAAPGQRAWRGAKWGFMLGVAAVAIGAAAEELARSNDRFARVSENSPRNPTFALAIIGGTTAGGAILGGALWKFRRWQDVPIR